MAKIFQILAPSETVELDREGRGEITFTVTNLARSVAARAAVVVKDETRDSWLSIQGADEQDLATSMPGEWSVLATVPQEAPPGRYPFRLDVVSELNPDEDFSEGPEITLIKLPAKRRPWWWWVLLVVSVLLFIGLLWWLIGCGADPAAEPTEEETAASASDGAQDSEGSSDEVPTTAGVKTPNLVGLSPADAREQAEELGLDIEPAERLAIEGLEISGQTPKPGELLEVGGTILLHLETPVPDLIGSTYPEAVEQLERVGLQAGAERYESNAQHAAGRVLKQSVTPPMSAEIGAKIDLNVSLGQCAWSVPFSSGFGLSTCRSGAAIAGLACSDGKCASWQTWCCPYLPSADLQAKVEISVWQPSGSPAFEHNGMFIDGFQCRGQGSCIDKRVRFLGSPKFSRGETCQVKSLGLGGVARCPDGMFIDRFGCKGRRCDSWRFRCCALKIEDAN